MSCKNTISLVFILSSVLLAATVTADDDNRPELKGTFRVDSNGTCVETPSGFGPAPLFQPQGGFLAYQERLVGEITFDGQGNAVQTHRGIDMFNGPDFALPAFSPFSTFEATCNYAYTVDADRTVTLTGNCVSFLPAGPAAGNTVTTSVGTFQGNIVNGGRTILYATVGTEQQGLTFSGGFSSQRICSTTTTHTRIRRR